MSDTVLECHYKLSHTEKNHMPLWTKHSTTIWTLIQKKVLDRDKTSLMLSQTFISIECCSSVITQFHINIKISVMDYLFQTQDIWVQLLMCNNTKVTCVYFNLFVEMNVTWSASKKRHIISDTLFCMCVNNRCIKWKEQC